PKGCGLPGQMVWVIKAGKNGSTIDAMIVTGRLPRMETCPTASGQQAGFDGENADGYRQRPCRQDPVLGAGLDQATSTNGFGSSRLLDVGNCNVK
ncbi:MAG: hypothetical protein AAF773_14130, partial [Cyanobacteria bacterium P01_D01_bin.115]